MGKSVTLTCGTSCYGRYSWERNSNGTWFTVSNGNKPRYNTKTTLAVGIYKYRCFVKNDAGSTVSNVGTVKVYGEYCHSIMCT